MEDKAIEIAQKKTIIKYYLIIIKAIKTMIKSLGYMMLAIKLKKP